VLLAGTELPSRAIRSQITSAVNVIVQTERLRGGARKVVSIAEVMGIVEGEIALQEIFTFHQVGVTPDGRAVGYHSATGTKTIFLDHFLSNGVHMPETMFVSINQPPAELLN
jgi:pilus assembly protein CpaF